MSDEQLADWSAQFDAGLAAEEDTDLEPLWNEVSAAVEAEPDHAGLRRLRIRMAEAFFQQTTHHEDLSALRRLEPGNREVLLDLAVLQHRWSHALAPEEEGDEQRTALESEARGWLAQMLREHRSDADFCAEVFARWSDASIYSPWVRLTLALETANAHPKDPRFARERALAWEDLANQVPESYDPDKGPLPMGFMIDVFGALWDPFLQERALDALARLLEAEPDDTDLLARRARLLEGRCDFAGAASAYEDARRAAEHASAAATTDDSREELASQAADLAKRAQLCRAGRVALASSMMENFAEAVAMLEKPMPRRDGASADAEAFADEMDRSMQEKARELDASLAEVRSTLPAHSVSDEQLENMRTLARQLAGSIVGSVQLTPLEKVPITPAQFEQDWAVALKGVREAFASLGWRELGWLEWPGYRAMFGHQVVSTVWVGPDAATVALAFSVKGTLSLDLETELESGQFVVTSPCRGRNFLAGGPDMDTLFVEPALPIPVVCALHAARVAATLVQSPGATLHKLDNLADVAAHQERGRERKTKFRLAHGLTESESLGVPHDFAEIFAPLLRKAVSEGLATLTPTLSQGRGRTS